MAWLLVGLVGAVLLCIGDEENDAVWATGLVLIGIGTVGVIKHLVEKNS